MCNKLAGGETRDGERDRSRRATVTFSSNRSMPSRSPLPHVDVVAGNKLNVENNTKMSFQAALTMPRSAQGRELSLRFTWRIMEQHQVPLRAQAGGRHELARQGSGLGTSVSPSWQPGKESCQTEDTTSCHLTPLSRLPQPSTLCCDEVE